MTTNFPTGLDTLTNPTSTDEVASVDHAAQHANANDGIEALQAKVGIDGSAVTSSHDYKLSDVSDGDKAVSTNGNQTIAGNKTFTGTTTTDGLEAGSGDITTTGDVSATDITATNITGTGDFSITGDTVDLSEGGTGANLSDPGADRIMFWDDSTGSTAYLEVGTGLSITDTTITATTVDGVLHTRDAQEDITIGDNVGVDPISGDIAKTNNDNYTESIGATWNTNARFDYNIKLGANKFVHVTAYSTTLYTKVYNAGTWGSAQTHTVDVHLSNNTREFTAVRVRDDVFAIQGFNNLYTYSVSGTTVTLEDTTDLGLEVDYGVRSPSINLEDDKALIVYNSTTTNNRQHFAIVSWSTYTPTLGDNITSPTGANVIVKIDSTHFAEIAGASITVYTVSGTTLSAGTSATASNSIESAFLLDTDILLVFDSGTDAWETFDVSANPPTQIDSGTEEALTGVNWVFETRSGVIVTRPYNNGGEIVTITHSSGTISDITEYTPTLLSGPSANEEVTHPVSITDGTFFVVSGQTDLSIQRGFCSNSIGIAQSTVSAGASVSVLVNGIDDNQSDLTIGERYDSGDDGSITVDSNGKYKALDTDTILIVGDK